jgi:hypothetical protein
VRSTSVSFKVAILVLTVLALILTFTYSGLFLFLLLGIAIFAFIRAWPKQPEQPLPEPGQVHPADAVQADSPAPQLAVQGPAQAPDLDEFEQRARDYPATLRIRSHEAIIHILESGDGMYEETFTDVEPYADAEIHEVVGGSLSSEYGYFNAPVYEPATIVWHWTKTEGTTRFWSTEFNPPLRIGKPISYVRKRRTFNMVYFNQQDRRDSLWDQEIDQAYEDMWFGIRQAIEEFRVELLFPSHQRPLDVKVEVRDSNDVIVARETERATDNLSVHLGIVVRLHLERPLCGYKYSIFWALPPTEAEASEFSAEIRGLREEALQRLRNADKGTAITAACLELRDGLRRIYHDDTASVLLYVYGRNNSQAGLCPVADTDSLLATGDGTMIRIGRTLVGQSYRRKAEMLDSPLNHIGQSSYYEPLPGANGTRPPFAAAVPLFIPASKGLRLGVVYIQSSSNYSGFNQLLDSIPAKEKFFQAITRWHVQRLMPALLPEVDTRDPEKLPWI